MLRKDKTNTVAFIDNNTIFINRKFLGINILKPNEINKIKYDYIIIPLQEHFQNIANQLLHLGINEEKIISFDTNNDIFVSDFRIAYAKKCFSLINENGVLGETAEVGVYKGNFSIFINEAFPERTHYLFDTFNGFPDSDVKQNINLSNLFCDTSIDSVKNLMPYPEKCFFVKGIFPESIPDNMPNHFSFVSLDADLYDPIYAGLSYFYPRLSVGGYIFVHDYGTPFWPGVKKAVDKFCRETHISFFPLLDRCSTIIISK